MSANAFYLPYLEVWGFCSPFLSVLLTQSKLPLSPLMCPIQVLGPTWVIGTSCNMLGDHYGEHPSRMLL